MDPQQNPYQVQNPDAQVPPQMPGAPPSSVPKVFGIIHIIYAAIGGLVALLGLGGGAMAKTVFKTMEDQAREEGANLEPFTNALDGLMTVSMIQSLFSIVFAVTLLIAGIKLLKYQESGRKLSNIWAISRIVVAIPLTFMTVSAQSKFQEEMLKLSEVKQSIDMSAMMGAGGVIGFFMVCVYPVVSLILINQAASKSALK